MIASVGYTADLTDYNLSLDDTPSAIEVNGEQMTSGQGKTDGTDEVDLVPAGIIQSLKLRELPSQRGGRFYQDVAAYGHFGRNDLDRLGLLGRSHHQRIVRHQ